MPLVLEQKETHTHSLLILLDRELRTSLRRVYFTVQSCRLSNVISVASKLREPRGPNCKRLALSDPSDIGAGAGAALPRTCTTLMRAACLLQMRRRVQSSLTSVYFALQSSTRDRSDSC